MGFGFLLQTRIKDKLLRDTNETVALKGDTSKTTHRD